MSYLNYFVILIFIAIGYFCWFSLIVTHMFVLLPLGFVSFLLVYLYLTFENKYLKILFFISPLCILTVFYLSNAHNFPVNSLFEYNNLTIPLILCVIFIFIVLSNLFYFKKQIQQSKTLKIEDRNLAIMAHWGGFVPIFIPFLNMLIPLIIWIAARNKSSLIKNDVIEALDFQISMTFYYLICILWLVFSKASPCMGDGIGIGVLSIIAIIFLQIYNLKICIKRLKIFRGSIYRYPYNIKLVSRIIGFIQNSGER